MAELTVTTPSGVAGASDVVVTNPDGQSGKLVGGFAYIAPPPLVDSVSPGSGPVGGGTEIIVSGTNFDPAAVVTVGGVEAIAPPTAPSSPPPPPSTLPDFSQATADYLAAFATAGDMRWAADATVPIHQRTYYDRPYAWYALGEAARGDLDQREYVDVYIDPNGGNIPMRQMQPDGLVELYMRDGKPPALFGTLQDTANKIVNHFINKGWTGPRTDWPDRWEGRVQERALLTMLSMFATEGATSYWRDLCTQVKDDILVTQSPDGSWLLPGDGYRSIATGLQVSSNFMAAAAMSALTRYVGLLEDDAVAILASVEAGMDWLWTTQWRPADGTFNYFSDSTPGGGPSSTPALNMLFVDVLGWLWTRTNDPKWISRGDAVFRSALTLAPYNVGVKQFNQFFRNSWRYLYFRDGFDLSHLQNPTEVSN